jgi:hypothetical protein
MSLASDLVECATAAIVAFNTYLIRSNHGDTNARIDEVHDAVNSTAQDQNARTDQLTASLTAAGVEVPERPPAQVTDTTGNNA